MKIRGSLIVTKNLVLPNLDGAKPREGFIALSDSTGKVHWGNLFISPLISGYTYLTKGALVLSNNKIYFSIVDNAFGGDLENNTIWTEVGGGDQSKESVLSQDIINALEAADSPSAGNPFATIADIQNLSIKGTDTISSILTKSAAIKNNLWISSDSGVDSYSTAVAVGDGLISDGFNWKTVGPIRGPEGAGVPGIQGPVGVGVTLKGSATTANIIIRDPASVGDLWIATTTGVDDNNDPVNIGDGLLTDGVDWLNIGPIRGPKGDTAYNGTYLIRAGITWISDYTYLVTADAYVIQGELYSASPVIVTLSSPDSLLDRTDVFKADTNGNIIIDEGVDGNPSIKPEINETLYVEISHVTLTKNTTSDPGTSSTKIFDENVGTGGGEFDAVVVTDNGATIELDYTADTYSNAIAIRIINGRNEVISFTAAAPIVFSSAFSGFTMRVKSLYDQFTTNITVRLYKEGSKVAKALLLADFGYDYTNTTDWQLVHMSLTDFAPYAIDFDSISIVLEDPAFAGKSDILIDALEYQFGLYVPPVPDVLEYTSQLINNGDGSSPFITVAEVSGDKNFIFTQGIVSDTWNINHALDKFPAVTIVDSAGTEVEGEIFHVNNNNLTLTFSSGFSGKAYLN